MEENKMAQFPNSWKYCATCAFWSGGRKCENFGQCVVTDTSATKGKCESRNGGWYGRDRNADQTCNAWQKWSALN